MRKSIGPDPLIGLCRSSLTRVSFRWRLGLHRSVSAGASGVMMMRSWRFDDHLGLLVASTLLCGLLIGCGGQQTPSDNGSDANSTSSPTTTKSSEGNSTDPADDDLAWVPFGPQDPTSPTPTWPVYNLFAEGKCTELRDYLNTDQGASIRESDVGQAMVAVCEAAIEGQQDQWSVAEARAGANPSAIDTSAIGDDCLGDAIAGLLNRALVWHREHPEQSPDVQDERVEGRTECGERYPPEEPPPTSEEPSPTPDEPSPTPDESTETTG